jgi:hypothetical protein
VLGRNGTQTNAQTNDGIGHGVGSFVAVWLVENLYSVLPRFALAPIVLAVHM